MVVNIYDTANEMEEQMNKTQEFTALKKAFADMQNDPDSMLLFTKFQSKQMELQKKQQAGQQPTQDEIKEMQDLAQQFSSKPLIKTLMEKEQAMDNMLQQLNEIITGPIRNLYNSVMPNQNNNDQK
ncbi:YlbF family regulator [Limosilactobacillus sp.]|uniref:YlbF family regulator n=1 Tax=Limosilactobacillus sp. TaxID=2773925 RepID=UPI00345F0A96